MENEKEKELGVLDSLSEEELHKYILHFLEKLLIDNESEETLQRISSLNIMDWIHDSLTAIKIKATIEMELGIDIDILEIFQDQTFSGLASKICELMMEEREYAVSEVDKEQDFFLEELQGMSDEEVSELYDQIQSFKSVKHNM